MRSTLIDLAMSWITGPLFRASEIWIDDALCRAARCRRVALRQRRVAAFVIVGPVVQSFLLAAVTNFVILGVLVVY
jgi:hypothetical protein